MKTSAVDANPARGSTAHTSTSAQAAIDEFATSSTKSVMVVGAYVKNVIVSHSGTTTRSLGGIRYNVDALAALGSHIKVRPVTNIGKDVDADLRKSISKFRSQVDLSGVRFTRDKTRSSTLHYDASGERTQRVQNKTRTIEARADLPFADTDAVIVNYVDGSEVRSTFLTRARELGFAGTSMVDVHNLCKATLSDGRQVARLSSDAYKAVTTYDYMQMNRGEAITAFELSEKFDMADLAEALNVTDLRPQRATVVTLDKDGAFCRVHDEERSADYVEKAKPIEPVDPTGCGDTFSANFLMQMLEGRPVRNALRVALDAASDKCARVDSFSDDEQP